jgi:hypothetical protein
MKTRARKVKKAAVGRARTVEREATRVARRAGVALRQAWKSGLEAASRAEADVEKQVRHFLKKNERAVEVQEALKELRTRFDKERKKAARELRGRLSGLQTRLRKDRRTLARLVEDGVHSTLVTLNIPSRKEIGELTRKVEELSRKIDGVSPRARRRR